MRMNSILLGTLCLGVVACSRTNYEPLEPDPFVVADSGRTSTVNSPTPTNVTISGSGNTVNIDSDVQALTVSGSNNLLNFATGVTVQSCTVSGSDNSTENAGTATENCDVTGAGNIGF